MPFKDKVLWQQKIDATVAQCKTILEEAEKDEKKEVVKRALGSNPDKSMFDNENIISLDDESIHTG